MPLLDGTRVAEELRNDPRTASIPLIAVSGALGNRRFRGRLRHFSSRIEKPFSARALMELIGSHLPGGTAPVTGGGEPRNEMA
jgi:CheY-like chemotaxis protein